MAGRYYLYLLIGCSSWLLFSCQSAEDTPGQLSTPVAINLPTIQSTPGPLCFASSTELQKLLGLGIIRLAIRKDSTLLVFPTPACNRKEGIPITLEDRPGWVLVSLIHLRPFEQSTNFRHFSFLWKATDTVLAAYGVQLDTSGSLYWVNTRAASTHYLQTWQEYLLHQRIRFLRHDSFYSLPSTIADTLPPQTGVFVVQEVKGPWMSVAYVAPDSQLSYDRLPTAGWRKWFCNGQLQIAVVDDTFMEDYILYGKRN